MSEFKNVTVALAANVYHNGNVTSRKITFEDGSFKTLGIMLPGQYEFGTEKAELMEITSGELKILLPDSFEWKKIVGGESFNVPANAKFKVDVITIVDYCCTYLD